MAADDYATLENDITNLSFLNDRPTLQTKTTPKASTPQNAPAIDTNQRVEQPIRELQGYTLMPVQPTHRPNDEVNFFITKLKVNSTSPRNTFPHQQNLQKHLQKLTHQLNELNLPCQKDKALQRKFDEEKFFPHQQTFQKRLQKVTHQLNLLCQKDKVLQRKFDERKFMENIKVTQFPKQTFIEFHHMFCFERLYNTDEMQFLREEQCLPALMDGSEAAHEFPASHLKITITKQYVNRYKGCRRSELVGLLKESQDMGLKTERRRIQEGKNHDATKTALEESTKRVTKFPHSQNFSKNIRKILTPTKPTTKPHPLNFFEKSSNFKKTPLKKDNKQFLSKQQSVLPLQLYLFRNSIVTTFENTSLRSDIRTQLATVGELTDALRLATVKGKGVRKLRDNIAELKEELQNHKNHVKNQVTTHPSSSISFPYKTLFEEKFIDTLQRKHETAVNLLVTPNFSLQNSWPLKTFPKIPLSLDIIFKRTGHQKERAKLDMTRLQKNLKHEQSKNMELRRKLDEWEQETHVTSIILRPSLTQVKNQLVIKHHFSIKENNVNDEEQKVTKTNPENDVERNKNTINSLTLELTRMRKEQRKTQRELDKERVMRKLANTNLQNEIRALELDRYQLHETTSEVTLIQIFFSTKIFHLPKKDSYLLHQIFFKTFSTKELSKHAREMTELHESLSKRLIQYREQKTELQAQLYVAASAPSNVTYLFILKKQNLILHKIFKQNPKCTQNYQMNLVETFLLPEISRTAHDVTTKILTLKNHKNLIKENTAINIITIAINQLLINLHTSWTEVNPTITPRFSRKRKKENLNKLPSSQTKKLVCFKIHDEQMQNLSANLTSTNIELREEILKLKAEARIAAKNSDNVASYKTKVLQQAYNALEETFDTRTANLMNGTNNVMLELVRITQQQTENRCWKTVTEAFHSDLEKQFGKNYHVSQTHTKILFPQKNFLLCLEQLPENLYDATRDGISATYKIGHKAGRKKEKRKQAERAGTIDEQNSVDFLFSKMVNEMMTPENGFDVTPKTDSKTKTNLSLSFEMPIPPTPQNLVEFMEIVNNYHATEEQAVELIVQEFHEGLQNENLPVTNHTFKTENTHHNFMFKLPTFDERPTNAEELIRYLLKYRHTNLQYTSPPNEHDVEHCVEYIANTIQDHPEVFPFTSSPTVTIQFHQNISGLNPILFERPINQSDMNEHGLWNYIRQDYHTLAPSSQQNETNLTQQSKVLKQLKNEAILSTRRHENEITKLKTEITTLRTCYDAQNLQATSLQDKLAEQKTAFARKTKKVANFLKSTLENKEQHRNSLNIVMMAAQVEKQERSRKKLEDDLYRESPTANRYPDRAAKRRALRDRVRLGEYHYTLKPNSTTRKKRAKKHKKSSSSSNRSSSSTRKRSPETVAIRANKKLKKIPPLPIDIVSRTKLNQNENDLTNPTSSPTESTDLCPPAKEGKSSSTNESTTLTEPVPSLETVPGASIENIVDLTKNEDTEEEQKDEVTTMTLSVSVKCNTHGFYFLELKTNIYEKKLLLPNLTQQNYKITNYVITNVDHYHQQNHSYEIKHLPVHRTPKKLITQYTSPNEQVKTDEHLMIPFLISGILINNLFSQLENFLQTNLPKRWIGETV